jgi:hypothetical protein
MGEAISKVQALRHAMLDPVEVQATMEIVALTPDLAPEMLDEVAAEYRERCERICAALEDLTVDDDESEAVRHIPLTWLATRYEWSRCNDQMQYQTILKGAADTLTMARGSMLSKIAEKLEALQTRKELFWSLKLAADPFGTVSRIPLMAKRLMRLTASAGRGINEVLQEFHAIRELLALHVEDGELLDKLDKSISKSIETVDYSVGIELNDLHAALEAELVDRLESSGVAALILLDNADPSELIPPDVSDLFFRVAQCWLKHLFAESIEATPAEREASDKSAHVTLSWRLTRNERRLTFTLRDDGLGSSGFTMGKDVLPPGLDVRHRQEPGVGSELTVESNFMLDGNSEYLSFSVFNGYDNSMLAIPAQYVRFISLVEAKALASASGSLLTATGELYTILDTARTVFGASADYSKDLIVFADLGEGRRLAMRVNEIHGICRGRVKPLPFGPGEDRVAGILSAAGQLVIVLELEGFFAG